MSTDEPAFIWVFNGGSQFPGGLFTTVDKAEAWIARHKLSGVLTKYPLDEGCFDWAVRTGCHGMRDTTLSRNREDPRFIGGFSSASQDHIHYEAGQRV